MVDTVLPIANGFYISDSLPISAQECVNWYVNIPQAPALAAETLFGTPGVSQLATTGTVQQGNRGGWNLKGKAYFVNGTSLYRLNADLTTDTLGTITGSGRVSLADNGTQLFIMVPGGAGYIFTDDPDTLTTITDLDFTANGAPQYVVFVDGYFVLTTDSKKFITSALNNGLAYDALDFGTAEANPDDTVAPWVFKNQLFIMGSITGEGEQNVGGSGFPFTRSGLYLSKGVSAPLSLIDANDTFMFIGAGQNESPAIWSFVGNTVQKTSTTAIDNLLQDLTEAELSQVFAWSYAEKGAYFVGFTLPATTVVIDTITGRWHERKSQQLVNGVPGPTRFRVNSVVNAYSKIIVADAFDGRIGEMSRDFYTEYGDTIIRRVSTQPFINQMNSFKVARLELTVESGVGNSAVVDPQMMMDISSDGGKTFKCERHRSMGKIGEYNHRAIWRRNGRYARMSVMRFTLSDAVKPVIISLVGDVL